MKSGLSLVRSSQDVQPVVQVKSFSDLGLSPKVLQCLGRAGFEHPTPIQAQAIPHALAGKDVIGTAATGTGKTAAFLLPIVERLAGKSGTRALVLAPTRELALQIGVEMERFGQSRQVRGAVVIGGVGMGSQIQAFRNGCEVIIATPGRLVDHLQQGTAKLDKIEVLVLDEADRMLDMGFKPQLTRILARLPKARQTLLFSATMAGEVAIFAGQHLRDPARVEVARSGTTPMRAEQQVFLANQQEKLPLLLNLLDGDDLTTLVFTRTKRRADKVAKSVERAGHRVSRIHADRSQAQRRAALDGFKDGSYRVLIATDIAARGIDVAEIGHVVNFDMPHVPEDYIHRIGRTARMEASGRASSFVSPEEIGQLHAIERLTRAQVPRAEVPRGLESFQADMKRSADAGPQHSERGPRRIAFGAGQGGRSSRVRAPDRKKARGGVAGHARSAFGESAERGSSGRAGKPLLVGSWRPKRRR